MALPVKASAVAPQVSVVIATRHRPDLLAACLERLAPGRQTLAADAYEVIVTDDGLDRPVRALVEERFAWARWVAGPARGRAANCNNGVRHARGEWIAFTDDDCLPEPGWLEGFLRHRVPGVRAYEGRTTCRAGCRSPLEHAPENLHGGLFFGCNIMIATELIRWLGGLDENFVAYGFEDLDLKRRIADAGETTIFVPAATVDHPPRRIRPGVPEARATQSRVYFYLKHREPCSLADTLALIAQMRIRQIVQRRLSLDSVIHATMTVPELLAIAWQWRRCIARAQALQAGERSIR